MQPGLCQGKKHIGTCIFRIIVIVTVTIALIERSSSEKELNVVSMGNVLVE